MERRTHRDIDKAMIEGKNKTQSDANDCNNESEEIIAAVDVSNIESENVIEIKQEGLVYAELNNIGDLDVLDIDQFFPDMADRGVWELDLQNF